MSSITSPVTKGTSDPLSMASPTPDPDRRPPEGLLSPQAKRSRERRAARNRFYQAGWLHLVLIAMAFIVGVMLAFAATLPAIECGNVVRYYVSLQSTDGDTVTLPQNAPAHTLAATAAESVVFADDFQTNQGWSVTNSFSLDSGQWERGLPAGTGRFGDPTSDFDGSGRCYLTENAVGPSDVDGGSTTLVSPVFDLTGLTDVHAVYSRWYSNSIGSGSQEDVFVVQVSADGGETWVELERVGPTTSDVQIAAPPADCSEQCTKTDGMISASQPRSGQVKSMSQLWRQPVRRGQPAAWYLDSRSLSGSTTLSALLAISMEQGQSSSAA